MMKKIIFLTIISLLGFIYGFRENENRIFKHRDIKLIEKYIGEDSLYMTEYLTSLKFHEKLNLYRVDMGLDTVGFNRILWMAAHNHCYWMSQNCPPNCKETTSSSHYQVENTKYFTGKYPGDRLSYVDSQYSWSGENVLSYPFNKKNLKLNLEELSENIAERTMNLWISSINHHRIMLLPKHELEGTAFVISKEGRVWATSLFGYRK
jgi:hypothetical protein